MVRPLIWIALMLISGATTAAEMQPPEQSDDVDLLTEELEETVRLGEETEQEISIDADGSMDIDDPGGAIESGIMRRWTIRSDVRVLGAYSDLQPRDGEASDDSDLLFRARIGATRPLTDSWRIGARLAAACTSEACKPDAIFEEETGGSSDNALAVDEAFVHWSRNERFDVALGRLQTKFITKGGVFAKSLDRNDSNNTRITWTDGLHGTAHHRNGWESHLILQHNPEDGPAQVYREPLDFESDNSRISAFVSIQNEAPVRFLTQRAIDISYYPAALKKDGLTETSRLEDYWGIVGRFAGRYPKRSSGRRLRYSLEAGYAPETPTRSGIGLEGSGDTNGFAIATTFAFMDFFPNHSLGLNLAHTGAGWLLSPQYNKNEFLAELRYVWVVNPSLTFDFRVRHREELDQLISAEHKRKELDIFARFTWRLRTERRTLLN